MSKFAVIGDIHHGPPESGILYDGIQRKLVETAIPMLEKFIEFVNSDDSIEFVVNLGDHIEDVQDGGVDLRYLREILSKYREINVPVYNLIGNHDQRTLSREVLRHEFEREQLYFTWEDDSFKYIGLEISVVGNHLEDLADIRSVIDEKQLGWLRKELSSTSKKVVVFSHYPSADINLSGNVWFDGEEKYGLLSNRKELRGVLEEAGNVIVHINGHVHTNYVNTHNGIHYFSQQSPIENFCQKGIAAETFSVITLENSNCDIRMFGNDSLNIKFDY